LRWRWRAHRVGALLGALVRDPEEQREETGMTSLWALFLLCLVLGNAKKYRLDPLSSSGRGGPTNRRRRVKNKKR